MKTVLLVGAAIIYHEKILLLKRLETKKFLPGYYDIPGGKVEEGEDPNKAILRELEEETGLNGEILRPYNVWSALIALNGADEHIVEIDYFVKADNLSKITLSAREFSEYFWADQHHIPEKITPELRATIIKAFSVHNALFS